MFHSESSGEISEERRIAKSVVNAVNYTIEIIDRFKGLFDFIPINNDYVHIVIGVLKTISDVSKPSASASDTTPMILTITVGNPKSQKNRRRLSKGDREDWPRNEVLW